MLEEMNCAAVQKGCQQVQTEGDLVAHVSWTPNHVCRALGVISQLQHLWQEVFNSSDLLPGSYC